LGGDDSWARAINAQGEVVGASTSPKGNTGYLWSASTGMLQLPAKGGCCTAANGVSNARSDGTRLVAGIDLSSGARAAVWVIR
jgi:probable HAF family extracellular repeat protein